MWKILAFTQKHLTWPLPLIMAAGLLFGTLTDPLFLKPLIMPLTFLMVYPMMINLQPAKLLSRGDIRVQSLTILINLTLIPFSAYLLGRLFFRDAPLAALGLLLAALLPTSGMTISWTGMAGGNVNAAVKMTVIGLILGSLTAPLYISRLMGTVVRIPLGDIFRQILLVVFLPMAAGQLTRILLIRAAGRERYAATWKGRFPLLSTLGVLGIVFTAMALKAGSILEDPRRLLSYLIPLVLLYGINYLVSTFIGKRLLPREEGMALVFGTVLRNLSIALAIAMTAFGRAGSEIALIIAMAYIIQVQSSAWYVRLTPRLFPRKPGTEEEPAPSPQNKADQASARV